MSELNGFAGKDDDEDRARAWIGKVKSAFVRDQSPDDEKAVLGGLCTGSARNWYRQLSRTTRGDWKELLREFQHAEETPLEYLHHLNVAGLRAKLRTLDDRDLAGQLALLSISDAGALEEVLRARQRVKNRQGPAHLGSSKYRQIGSNAQGASRCDHKPAGQQQRLWP
ncbi:hypothetical protein L914_20529 [Phytophthora nicotianae]|uniref:Retrotransposon gag domain-containing protein n=1 Tax=Phytophthora nicotianae TaxID=4792 RepID=W2M8S9_PHYNI|nr:hypothetical protein L914_20529 [Phytophthora nicotianae]